VRVDVALGTNPCQMQASTRTIGKESPLTGGDLPGQQGFVADHQKETCKIIKVTIFKIHLQNQARR